MKYVHQEEALINRSFTIKASNDSEPTFKKKLHGIINSYRDNLRWLMFCLKLWWTSQISLTVFVFAFSKCGLNIPHKSVFIFYKLHNMIYDDCLRCDLFVIIWFLKNHINFAGYCSILRYSLFFRLIIQNLNSKIFLDKTSF